MRLTTTYKFQFTSFLKFESHNKCFRRSRMTGKKFICLLEILRIQYTEYNKFSRWLFCLFINKKGRLLSPAFLALQKNQSFYSICNPTKKFDLPRFTKSITLFFSAALFISVVYFFMDETFTLLT
jgi:hypothetical protein